MMEFCDDFIMPCVKAGAVYENKYLLGTSMARPAISKKLVEIARKEGAVAICHGATGKGNDQIRFELSIRALAPDIKIIAPWRMTDLWTMQSREDEIEYCRKHGIDLPFDTKHSYSRDRNLWHISHEGLELEDPSVEPNYDDLLVLTVPPEKAPDKPEYVTMTFEAGIPKSLNGKEMKVSEIITELNKLGGKHGHRHHRYRGKPCCGHEIPRRIRGRRAEQSLWPLTSSLRNSALTALHTKSRKRLETNWRRSYMKENGSHRSATRSRLSSM